MHTFDGAAREDATTSTAPPSEVDACRLTPLSRILPGMSDAVTRLNAALEGRYAIERELGEGGMATVYLADDLKHERKVALKVRKREEDR